MGLVGVKDRRSVISGMENDDVFFFFPWISGLGQDDFKKMGAEWLKIILWQSENRSDLRRNPDCLLLEKIFLGHSLSGCLQIPLSLVTQP